MYRYFDGNRDLKLEYVEFKELVAAARAARQLPVDALSVARDADVCLKYRHALFYGFLKTALRLEERYSIRMDKLYFGLFLFFLLDLLPFIYYFQSIT